MSYLVKVIKELPFNEMDIRAAMVDSVASVSKGYRFEGRAEAVKFINQVLDLDEGRPETKVVVSIEKL